ncbi:hypothetical protein AA309_10515 [Microvirga vignae]|uniref:Uncharacterized protein n=1 Tax=Microvirga vignae TaxID=1225564 RepID=A0A0H1RCS7_9HYPH|nr:hypothetical protein [Microvirga vignae]KLK93008.1 hypothetical protein AA309_10515 [Microvirga vignae]
MADIIHLPVPVPDEGRTKDAKTDILESLVQVSRGLRQIQGRIAESDLDDSEKLAASQAILAAVRELQ